MFSAAGKIMRAAPEGGVIARITQAAWTSISIDYVGMTLDARDVGPGVNGSSSPANFEGDPIADAYYRETVAGGGLNQFCFGLVTAALQSSNFIHGVVPQGASPLPTSAATSYDVRLITSGAYSGSYALLWTWVGVSPPAIWDGSGLVGLLIRKTP